MLNLFKRDARFDDGREHYWHDRSELEFRAWIYWDAYEYYRQTNDIVMRERYWDNYMDCRRKIDARNT